MEVVTLRAPLPRPLRSLFCIGRNYRAHAAELAATVFRAALPETDPWPIVFGKLGGDAWSGRYGAGRRPPRPPRSRSTTNPNSRVVIGRGGRDILAARAMDHVFGYTVVNDVTARDVQLRHQQWVLGKSFDTFCPMGPWIVTADEPSTRRALRVRGWVNGALRQDGQDRAT